MSESVRAVERALDILLCFSQEDPVLSLTQIADLVGIPKSTGHRLLGTLESKRFVNRDYSTGNYRLGFRFIEMASLVFRHAELERCVQPHLHRLSAECGETVDLAILDGSNVVYLQVVESASGFGSPPRWDTASLCFAPRPAGRLWPICPMNRSMQF